jgi:hypothetical protein
VYAFLRIQAEGRTSSLFSLIEIMGKDEIHNKYRVLRFNPILVRVPIRDWSCLFNAVLPV